MHGMSSFRNNCFFINANCDHHKACVYQMGNQSWTQHSDGSGITQINIPDWCGGVRLCKYWSKDWPVQWHSFKKAQPRKLSLLTISWKLGTARDCHCWQIVWWRGTTVRNYRPASQHMTSRLSGSLHRDGEDVAGLEAMLFIWTLVSNLFITAKSFFNIKLVKYDCLLWSLLWRTWTFSMFPCHKDVVMFEWSNYKPYMSILAML